MAEQTVTLQPGESKAVAFEVTPATAKTYSVSVNGLSGSFRAIAIVVSFTGTVTDAETRQALSGATVEMWNANATALLSSTTTDSAGQYRFSDIVVPVTLVFKYKKSGYKDTVTIPIYLDPSGGGLNVEMVPLIPTQLALYYSNPNSAAATHWNVYDWNTGTWLAEGLPKLITEAIVFVPATNRLFVVFREARNAFFDMVDYGPYVIDITKLGQYTWNARNKTLNGVSATSLMGTSGSIRAKVLSQEETNVPGYKLLTLQVLSASGVGVYFIGKAIKADAGVLQWSLVGIEITADLKVQTTSPGNFQQYPGFVLVISNIGFPLGYPEYLYALQGTTTRGWDPEDGYGFIAIGYYSKYGLPGIPILFEAWGGGVRRDLVYQETSGVVSYYRIGNPGTQSIQKTLPTNEIGYWLDIFNSFQDAKIDVSLWTGTYWKKVATL